MTRRNTKRWLLLAVLINVGAMLACQGNVQNMTVGGIPKYVCPSATPRPTDTPLPPDPPTYPAAFQATLDYSYIDTERTVVNIQYLAQNAGTITLAYSLVYTTGGTASSSVVLAYTGNYAGVQASFPLYLPSPDILAYAQVSIYSALSTLTFTIPAYPFPYYTSPNPPPCCLPPPIYPTPRPTFTPYPTPTLFEMVAPTAFFLEDPIYNYQPPIQLRLRMKSPIQDGMLAFIIPLLSAATWTIEITNVGTVEYDFLGAGYTYVSEVDQGGLLTPGVWPPSHYAATFLGIVEQAYGPQAIQPGQTVTVRVAAWIPAGSHVSKVALLLNPYQSGDPGWATFTPGSGKAGTVIQWTNALNTICKGEIAYP
ncbi:MAG: hypothetical protein ACYDBJ_21230 [Aggregatilineales bacterium]